MSRIGKKIIPIPQGVTVTLSDTELHVKGPKGEDVLGMHPNVHVAQSENAVTVTVDNEEEKNMRALWGTYRQLIANCLIGVTQGFEKKLEMVGVGYKAALKGDVLSLEVGFSHPVDITLPKGVSVAVEKNTMTVTGVNKQIVGAVSAAIRKIRPPEPYKGKGIKYTNEVIRRKAGKAAKAAGAK